MTTYAQALEAKRRVDADLKRTSVALRAFPRGPNGLTPDDVKFSLAYRKAKAEFDAAFGELRRFNRYFNKTFAAEIKADRRLVMLGAG